MCNELGYTELELKYSISKFLRKYRNKNENQVNYSEMYQDLSRLIDFFNFNKDISL